MIQTYSRFVVSHRPYEGLKLRAGFHTGDVIAGVQVQDALSLPQKLSFVNKLSLALFRTLLILIGQIQY